jgi:hypothetical protein
MIVLIDHRLLKTLKGLSTKKKDLRVYSTFLQSLLKALFI